jgi:hypothetical protein
MANFVDFDWRSCGSRALAKALVEWMNDPA